MHLLAAMPCPDGQVTTSVTAASLEEGAGAQIGHSGSPDTGCRPRRWAGTALQGCPRHAASGCRRHARRRDRGVAHDRRAAPAGPWPAPERGRARSPASLLSLRRVVEPPGRVRGGAGAALSLVSRREPARRGRASRAHPEPDPGDRSGAPRPPRSSLSGVPHDVGPPARGRLHGGRSRRALRVSRLPPAARRAGRELSRGREGVSARAALVRGAAAALPACSSGRARSSGGRRRAPREGRGRAPSARGSRNDPFRASPRRSPG